MTEDARPEPAGGGLKQILVATVVAGAIGYLIQLFVPTFVGPEQSALFLVMWSATYLVVSCLAGIQQEVTRASSHGTTGSGVRTWLTFTLAAAAVAGAGVAVVFALIGPTIFRADAPGLIGAVVVAAVGYTFVASISGAMYGTRTWNGVALMTISDSLLRAVAFAVALLCGGAVLLLGWATAVPFVLAAAIVWLAVRRDVLGHLVLDVGIGRLARNASVTLVASLAMGLLISGLPLLLSLLASDAPADLLTSLMLINNLTRAPLVVPILALQGFLLVQFRDAGPALLPRTLKWLGIVAAGVVVISGVAALFGPAIMAWLYPHVLTLGSVDFAVIVLGGGLTGIMCVTGQAVLAAARHREYTAGWIVSAAATIVVLLLPFDVHTRILTALVVGPALGVLVHLAAIARLRRAA